MMKESSVAILGSILWAFAYIASAFLFRGRALGDWIEGILLAGWWVFFISYYAGRGSGRSRKS
jgi:hypothetical protein